MLNLNPGHSEADARDYRRAAFRDAMLNNLRQTSQLYPFYPLNPLFADTGAGRWWTPRLSKLKDDARLPPEEFARRIMVIEWFPYHSRRFVRPIQTLPSQSYSFHLAKTLLEAGRLVIRMRSRKLWQQADARLGEVYALSNPRCGHISPRNAPSYNAILERIRANGGH